MKIMTREWFKAGLVSALLFYPIVYAAPLTPEEQQAKQSIETIYAELNQNKSMSMPVRLDKISHFFLNKAYFLGPLGEGRFGKYDEFPLYRVDVFDCLTYVETVLAIAFANDFQSFEQMIKNIRYQDGKISFINRNHFTDLDWNIHNQHLGIVKDITLTILDENHQSVAQFASAQIDKPSWYEHMSLDHVRLIGADENLRRQRWALLKTRGRRLTSEMVRIPFIPLSALFDKAKKPNAYLFKQIPDGAIIEIVRPNWDLKKIIGTHMNVSHLGFAFMRDGKLLFRNASTLKGRVVDQPLAEYLSQQQLKSPTVKGINIQQVQPNRSP
jgi:hypothetical protein